MGALRTCVTAGGDGGGNGDEARTGCGDGGGEASGGEASDGGIAAAVSLRPGRAAAAGARSSSSTQRCRGRGMAQRGLGGATGSCARPVRKGARRSGARVQMDGASYGGRTYGRTRQRSGRRGAGTVGHYPGQKYARAPVHMTSAAAGSARAARSAARGGGCADGASRALRLMIRHGARAAWRSATVVRQRLSCASCGALSARRV